MKNILKKTIGASSGRLCGTVASFLLTIVLTNSLSLEDVGLFYFSITAIFGLAIISRFGMGQILIINIGHLHKTFRSPLIGSFYIRTAKISLTVTIILTLVALIIFYILHLLNIDIVNKLNVWFILISLPAVVAMQLAGSALKGLNKQTISTYLEFFFVPFIVIFTSLSLPLLSIELNISTMMATYLICTIVIAIIMNIIVIHEAPFCRETRSKYATNQLMRAPTFLQTELCNYLIAWSSLLIIPFLLSLEDTGIYNISLRISALISIIMVGIQAVGTPVLSKLFATHNYHGFKKSYRNLHILMLVSGWIFLFFVIFFGHSALSIFGDEYLTGYKTLLILSIGTSINLMLGPAGLALAILGKERIIRNITVIVSLVTIFLTIILAYIFGPTGAALAGSISIISQKIFLCFHSRKAVNNL